MEVPREDSSMKPQELCPYESEEVGESCLLSIFSIAGASCQVLHIIFHFLGPVFPSWFVAAVALLI